jgi:hypothetical protein
VWLVTHYTLKPLEHSFQISPSPLSAIMPNLSLGGHWSLCHLMAASLPLHLLIPSQEHFLRLWPLKVLS